MHVFFKFYGNSGYGLARTSALLCAMRSPFVGGSKPLSFLFTHALVPVVLKFL